MQFIWPNIDEFLYPPQPPCTGNSNDPRRSRLQGRTHCRGEIFGWVACFHWNTFLQIPYVGANPIWTQVPEFRCPMHRHCEPLQALGSPGSRMGQSYIGTWVNSRLAATFIGSEATTTLQSPEGLRWRRNQCAYAGQAKPACPGRHK